ncbi:MAG TPA: Na-translocating system protein MpsC family protein [Nitrospiraceae bacterium]|nr:Na-translocating system protein MpsC family protein [Nitrospiraceae bacterium]
MTNQDGRSERPANRTIEPGSVSLDEFIVDRFLTAVQDKPRKAHRHPAHAHERHEKRRPPCKPSQADIEYAVMLAILDFYTEWMQVTCSHVQVEMSEDVIRVTVTRARLAPAEQRLAQLQEGRSLLQRVHEAVFKACQDELRRRLELAVKTGVKETVASLDATTGRSEITITLGEPAADPASGE